MAGRKYAQRNAAAAALSPGCGAILILVISLSNCSDLYRNQIPEPIMPDYQGITQMYWKIWEIMGQNIVDGNRENGFSRHYINCDDDILIHQNSTISTALFGVYGNSAFPVMPSLDNFYRGQRTDGFISCVYNSLTGEYLRTPSVYEPMINPPLFTWAELKYYRLTGDKHRLRKYFPVWEKYFEWIDGFCHAKGEAASLYYNTSNGSQMANSPHGVNDLGGWVDMSAQMALFSEHLAVIADVLDEHSKVAIYRQHYQQIATEMRLKMWDADNGCFSDLSTEGRLLRTKSSAMFWPLIAGIADTSQAPEIIAHLRNTAEFDRHHRYPSLAASDDEYSAGGAYWRGGVWGSENYMIISGLKRYGEYELAATAAWNHITNMEKVFTNYVPDTALVDEKYRAVCKNTVWEIYSPENDAPGTRWDTRSYCRPNYIPTAGQGPVAMLIEDILGFSADGPGDELVWRPWLLNKHGIRNLKFGNNLVTIWCEKRDSRDAPLEIKGLTSSPLRLTIILGSDSVSVKQPRGRINLKFSPDDFKVRDAESLPVSIWN